MNTLNNKLFALLLIFFVTIISCKSKEKKESTAVTPTNNISTIIDSIHLEMSQGKYGLVDRFMVIQNEELLADYKYGHDYEMISKKYDTVNHLYNYNHPNWHPFYNKTELHTLQSVTKSIASILLGIALDLHADYTVDTKVMPLFKDYELAIEDNRRNDITIKDLLTMRSGLEWNEDDYNDENNDCVQLEASDDWISFVLNKPTDTIPGTRFEYNSGASVLLGKITRIISGKRIDKWAEEKLFEPLGITEYYWKETPKGEIDTEGGLYLKAEDLAKIGTLFLNNGKWNNEQIVSKNWVTNSIRPVATNLYPDGDFDMGYGYQWWIPKYTNGKANIFNAQGYGGQYLFVAPEYNIIVLVYGWNINDTPEKLSWYILQDRMIPALKRK